MDPLSVCDPETEPPTSVLWDLVIPKCPPLQCWNPIPFQLLTQLCCLREDYAICLLFLMKNPLHFFVAAISKCWMGKTNTTSLYPQWLVSLRTSQPTFSFFLHPQREIILLNTELHFLAPNLPKVKRVDNLLLPNMKASLDARSVLSLAEPFAFLNISFCLYGSLTSVVQPELGSPSFSHPVGPCGMLWTLAPQ